MNTLPRTALEFYWQMEKYGTLSPNEANAAAFQTHRRSSGTVDDRAV